MINLVRYIRVIKVYVGIRNLVQRLFEGFQSKDFKRDLIIYYISVGLPFGKL